MAFDLNTLLQKINQSENGSLNDTADVLRAVLARAGVIVVGDAPTSANDVAAGILDTTGTIWPVVTGMRVQWMGAIFVCTSAGTGSGNATWVQNTAPRMTYAELAAAVATGFAGRAFVTDIGIHGSDWYSNGVTFGLVGGRCLLAASYAAGAAITGDTAEHNQLALPLPGGIFGTNGGLDMNWRFSCTGTGNHLSKFYVGPTENYFFGISGTSISNVCNGSVRNQNSASAQVWGNKTNAGGGSTTDLQTTAANTSVDFTWTFAYYLASGSDSITPKGYEFWLVRP